MYLSHLWLVNKTMGNKSAQCSTLIFSVFQTPQQ